MEEHLTDLSLAEEKLIRAIEIIKSVTDSLSLDGAEVSVQKQKADVAEFYMAMKVK